MNEEAKVAFFVSLSSGKALEWATAVWDVVAHSSLDLFKSRFTDVFEHPEGGINVEDRFISIQQGRNTAADHALLFRTLAAQSGWPDGPLKTVYRRGLSRSLQAELASHLHLHLHLCI